jgi:hypothetical protein
VARFNPGDKVVYKSQILEVLYWPGEGEFFAQFALHRPDGGSTVTTDHIANLDSVELLSAAPVVDYTTPVEPPAAAVEPVVPTSVEPTE